ncbi:hypothetical protein C8Q69DRAFT_267476 [Paecilomyces variotii]|uniref:SET domain-containing protein n=1 Tax=Byssochlamys spectabilis TaxID=264951 RepID=A0A443HVL4_BYSSP|nr:hypothetical protein C8Q69DRAFT_267476 [Paecilomyces variotii]KAJ9351864.1 hypothetical protein DTO280E4_8089 [Paecilomyces variotii]RWQ95800.1 hypothetical protein C8Q69DRAFT_267476 [Paecilomyces variotii]
MKREYLPIEALPAWSKLNGISFNGVAFERFQAEDGTDKGSGVVATEEKYNGDPESEESKPEFLITVPPDMVLSLDLVQNYAKSDRYLREVLEAVGDYGKTARGAILIFLLLHITYSSPDFENVPYKIGVSNPWSEYIKFLPASVPLPTFYTEEEHELLYGTSLKAAVDAKISSLEKEFDLLRESTQSIAWCERVWWGVETGKLTLDDWKQVDAMYRSRALDLPGTGHAMVPCIDMANHSSGDATVALYETDSEGNAVLQLRWGKKLRPRDEVTITYGDEKGASEMIFSYGFLESEVNNARQLFLGLDIPDDDPLKPAKKIYCQDAPGVRLFLPQSSEQTDWESGFVWWACVNEEDGLDFSVLQTNEGQRELKATWKGNEIPSSSSLRDIISNDPLWDVFQLRAVVFLLERLEGQFAMLQASYEFVSNAGHDESGTSTGVRSDIYGTIVKLRKLESELLERGIHDLSKRRDDLLSSETVVAYFSRLAEGPEEEEDFS